MSDTDLGADPQYRSERRDGFLIEWDVPVRMDDGLVLRANVYRPDDGGRYPVILSYGPYAKDLAWQDGYETAWELFSAAHPDAIAGSSNAHQSWEVVDPEKWVPDGYICVRVDSRGAGRSPGYIDHFSMRETRDFAICIDWAGAQPWCNGKVGLTGISYYAINQWHVAGLRPRHLAAMCVWEGAADFYRDMSHQGGILTTFLANWYDMQVKTVQHGLGENGPKSRVHGGLVCGPETLSAEALAKNRSDYGGEILEHALDDDWHRQRSAHWEKIETPFLSAASWGGQGLHPRGNYEGFMRAASKEKWLEVHGFEHWTEFYTPYGENLQKQFFGHYLKGADNGWKERPPVMLKVRHVGEKFINRTENEWPLARTRWTKFYLNPHHMSLDAAPADVAQSIAYGGMGEGVTFMLPPFDAETEITGPIASKLFVSSETADADLFLVVRLFTPDMKEITFQGTLDPNTPIAQGWLRASHRKLVPELSTEWKPYQAHDEKQPLTPGEIYELDVEVWPTCIVVPPGYRLALSVRGKDYEYSCATTHRLSNMKNVFRGCGPFLHDDPTDRPEEIFSGDVTLHCGPRHPSYIMLPLVPPK